MSRFQLGAYWIERRKGTANWQRTWRDGRGVKQRASLGTSDFEQAKVALAEWFVANATIKDQQPQDVPVAMLLTRYMARHGEKIPSKSTAKRAVALWVEFWGDRTVADMSVDAQEEFLAWLRSRTRGVRTYSEGYVRRVLGVGQSALNRAWKRHEIVQVPWVELPPIGEPYPHTATAAQMAAFLNAIPKESHLWMYCLIRLGTGCRGDAALGLQPFQIDWHAGLVRLNPEGRQQTKKYRPVVPMTDMLRQALAGCDEAFYVNWHGRQIASIKKAWAKVRIDAGLPASLPSPRSCATRSLPSCVAEAYRTGRYRGRSATRRPAPAKSTRSSTPRTWGRRAWRWMRMWPNWPCMCRACVGSVRGQSVQKAEAALARKPRRCWVPIGGRYKDRTCDPYHVKVVLYR